MGILQILNIVSIIASGFAPFKKQLQWVELGAKLTTDVVNELTSGGAVVVDENGNPLTKEQVSEIAQAHWTEAIAGLDRIKERAQNERARTDG